MSLLRRAALVLPLALGLAVGATTTASAAGTPYLKKFSAKGGGGYIEWFDIKQRPVGEGGYEDADDINLVDTRADKRGVKVRVEHPKGQYTASNMKGKGKEVYKYLPNLKAGQYLYVTVCLTKKSISTIDNSTCGGPYKITE
jgi:hypothetical protein